MSSSRVVKRKQIAIWVMNLKSCSKPIAISEYSYDCIVSGEPKNKTLIVFLEEAASKGIIAIDKPLEEVELLDVIKLCKRIRC